MLISGRYLHMTTLRILFALLLAACLAAPSASAQVLYGSVVGNVTDPTGAPVPGAKVTIRNTETGQTRETETDVGVYSFLNVASGKYDVESIREGFTTSRQQGVQVTINNVSRVNFTLALGAVIESVQVGAQAAVLQTDRAEVRQEVNSNTLVNIPVPPGRNYQQSFIMLPGFTPPTNQNSEVANPSRSLAYNVNGTSKNSNNVRIDGTGANGVWLPQNVVYIPALESIETVNVVTNSFDAEQGLAGGSAVNVQVKSGTNQVHGSAFEYHNDNATQAKRFFTPAGQSKTKTVFNQFGGTVGGPIKHDKLFYFLSYERTLDRRGQAGFATVPTAAIKSGDMSASPGLLYDPATGNADGSGRTPFVGNVVPRSRMEPIALKLADMTPLPNLPGLLTSNYYRSWPYGLDRQTVDSKINWNATQKLSMYGRYSFLKYHSFSQGVLGPLSGERTDMSGFTNSASVAATYVLTPNLLLDGNFGWNLLDTGAWQNRVDEKIGSDLLGIPGTNGPNKWQGGWPGFNISSYTGLGYSGGVTPVFYHDPVYQYTANGNYTRGAHNIRFGVDISRQHMNHLTHELVGASGSSAGTFDFTGGLTALRGGATTNQFHSYANFLLGTPTGINKILMVPDRVTTRATLGSLYVRDQWQMSRKLTLSYGTRWEYYPIPMRADRGFERYDFNTNKMLICGVGANPSDCGVTVNKRLFAPRLGVAYRITDRFVMRAGYGITIDPYSMARPMRTNFPVLVALNLTGPSTYQSPGTLKGGIQPLAAPDPNASVIDVPPFAVVGSLGDTLNRGYIQSWNYALQKELKWGFTGQAGYVATRQVKQLGFLEMNAGAPGGGNASRPLFQKFGRSTSTRLITPLGTGHYDALQARLDRRFANSYQVQVAYTWSKATGICCNDNSDGTPAIQLPQYYRLNRSVTGYDQPHVLVVSSIADLPFGKGKKWLNSGAGRVLAGGWRVNTMLTASSGLPFSVTASGTSLNAPGNTQRADQVKASVEKLGGIGPGQPFFDPLAFAPVTDARFGTAGFNSLRGPGSVNLDLGLFREFSIKDRVNLQFRAEAFNSTNTPHFANPGTNVSNLQLNANGTVRSLGGYTEVTGTKAGSREGVDERTIRFGLRLSF